ncbi:MAG: universal stress protein [Hahellaceae bacterium]|nr:universal stress protein [Hahellaceae bacterium]
MYQHILVAADLSDETFLVIQRAVSLATPATRLTLMHVVEPVGYAYGGDIPLDLSEVTDSLVERARERLSLLATQLQLNAERVTRVGRAASELHQFAENEQVDLIVVGSHGRSGLKLLLGSTANSVLHGATCDVLAVRIPSAKKA